MIRSIVLSAAVVIAFALPCAAAEALAARPVVYLAEASTAELADASSVRESAGAMDDAAAIYPQDPPRRLVLVPFENLSGVEGATIAVEAAIASLVEQRQWSVDRGEGVVQALERHRVRYFDSIPPEARRAILAASDAGAVLTGVVYAYTEGKNPHVAVSARLVRGDGTLAWSNVAALTGADTEGAFGFGKKETREALLPEALRQLLGGFPAPGQESVSVAGPERAFFTKGAVSFRAADVDPMEPQRVCILPFENASDVPDAARVVAEVLAVRLPATTGFDVVEPAIVRDAAARAGIGTFSGIQSEALKKMAPAVGTSLFLKGTVFEYSDPTSKSTATPTLTLEITLIDVEQGRVIWSAQHEKRGHDYAGLLMLGEVSSSVALADHVVAEIIDAGKKVAPKGEAATTARGVRRPPEKHSRLRGARK